jgi:hypothetical protein
MPMPEHPWPEGVNPPLGSSVVVTLEDGTIQIARRTGGRWEIGVDNNPEDVELTKKVTSWRHLDPTDYSSSQED